MAMVEETHPTRALVRRRRRRNLVVLSSAALALAAVVAIIVVVVPSKDAAPEHVSNEPAQLPERQVKAKLPAEAAAVARRFVQTAVARKNLAEAYDLVGPSIRGTMTREEWMKGDIPVVPYPIGSLEVAPFKVDYSYTNEALIEVALLPKASAGVKPQLFSLVLKKIGPGSKAHWVVDLWTPRGSALLPQGNN